MFFYISNQILKIFNFHYLTHLYYLFAQDNNAYEDVGYIPPVQAEPEEVW